MMTNVKPIFKDKVQQEQFDRDGYIKITLLTLENVNELLSLFNGYFPNPSADFFSSSYENDYLLKREISNAIGKIILPNLEAVFNDYTWFGSAFLSKGNGPRSEMPMHQDWTIVDESNYVALNIWTPLQETTESNGTLEVIRGSHRWHQSLRAPTLPFYFEGHQHLLKGCLVPIPTLPTEAIVLNQAIIHYSKSNTTANMRVAITTGIKSQGAPMIFHYWNKETPGVIEQFSEEDDFLIRFSDFHQTIFRKPEIGESVGLRPFKLPKISAAETLKLIGGLNDSPPEISFGQKVAKWLKL